MRAEVDASGRFRAKEIDHNLIAMRVSTKDNYVVLRHDNHTVLLRFVFFCQPCLAVYKGVIPQFKIGKKMIRLWENIGYVKHQSRI